MRITLDIPGPLLNEAQRLLGTSSRSDTVAQALRELVRRRRIGSLKAVLGRVKLDLDLRKSRRRPRNSA